MKYSNLREEELKNKVARDYFAKFDSTQIIGNIDFCIAVKNQQLTETQSLLWAEAKPGKADLYKSFTQLILTIGKARTFDKKLPPPFLGAFDSEKIAFIRYSEIYEIFYQSDFNWNVAPSDHTTKEFKQVYAKVKKALASETFGFNFEHEDSQLKEFIGKNFVAGNADTAKVAIDKNNFMVIYNQWLESVKPSIAVNWDIAKQQGVIDGDFYLADLLAKDNETIKDQLHVVLKKDFYELDRKFDKAGMYILRRTEFKDGQKAHSEFWSKYQRPPKEEYWDYIIERRDLLVPQDIRERKGSYFTPRKWVVLSQEYLADFLGENWQDEYYVWNCAAGTGNLLADLVNKDRIWASTVDKQDVDVMHERITGGANLRQRNVFQFDFLNDDFSKLPQGLKDIINNPAKRKKLVIYINPPYAEVSSKKIKGKVGVNQTETHKKYHAILGTAGRELYAQFLIRIYKEIPDCVIAEFSKLKTLQGPAFDLFRNSFKAKLEKCFVAPANTFDNVRGSFPIGFKIWDTSKSEKFSQIRAGVFNADGRRDGKKAFYSHDKNDYINKWISDYKTKEKPTDAIGYMDGINANDFQHNNIVYILNTKEQLPNPRGIWINRQNLIPVAVYFAVRHCIEANWLNDRDQFLVPKNAWEKDIEFQNDCLTFALFNNNIQSKHGTNSWIPFREDEAGITDDFESNFMTDFISGSLNYQPNGDLFHNYATGNSALEFSAEAQAVFDAGRELWQYYHAQPYKILNASYYEIRAHFQGVDSKGRMNNRSGDEQYTQYLAALRDKLKLLAEKIEPKVYKYGFLKR